MAAVQDSSCTFVRGGCAPTHHRNSLFDTVTRCATLGQAAGDAPRWGKPQAMRLVGANRRACLASSLACNKPADLRLRSPLLGSLRRHHMPLGPNAQRYRGVANRCILQQCAIRNTLGRLEAGQQQKGPEDEPRQWCGQKRHGASGSKKPLRWLPARAEWAIGETWDRFAGLLQHHGWHTLL